MQSRSRQATSDFAARRGHGQVSAGLEGGRESPDRLPSVADLGLSALTVALGTAAVATTSALLSIVSLVGGAIGFGIMIGRSMSR